MFKKIILATAVAVAVSGCATDGTMTRSEKGALIGGLAGAVIGKSTSNHDGKRAVIGGAVGAAIGAGIGSYMDKQEAELRKQTQGTGIEVERHGNDIVLNMPDNITFDTNSSQIKPRAYTPLNNLASTLSQFDQTRIIIAGHTDSRGSDSYNQRLSERRAYSVRNYLIDQGVGAQRMRAIGYGESRPVASNDTEYGRAKNRRVEITLQAIQQ